MIFNPSFWGVCVCVIILVFMLMTLQPALGAYPHLSLYLLGHMSPLCFYRGHPQHIVEHCIT